MKQRTKRTLVAMLFVLAFLGTLGSSFAYWMTVKEPTDAPGNGSFFIGTRGELTTTISASINDLTDTDTTKTLVPISPKTDEATSKTFSFTVSWVSTPNTARAKGALTATFDNIESDNGGEVSYLKFTPTVPALVDGSNIELNVSVITVTLTVEFQEGAVNMTDAEALALAGSEITFDITLSITLVQ